MRRGRLGRGGEGRNSARIQRFLYAPSPSKIAVPFGLGHFRPIPSPLAYRSGVTYNHLEMPESAKTPTEQVRQCAQETLIALRKRERFLASFFAGRASLHEAISGCAVLASQVDPSNLAEDQLSDLVAKLSELVDAMEWHFAKYVSAQDSSECQFFGDSIRSLKDSRRWIAQGLSADPAKRPSEGERRAAAITHAATAWADLIA